MFQGVRLRPHDPEGGHPGHGGRHAVPGDAQTVHRHCARLPPGLRGHVGPLVRRHQAMLRGDQGTEGGLPGDTDRLRRQQAGLDQHPSGDQQGGRVRVGPLRTTQVEVHNVANVSGVNSH